jgi:D-alanyl-D-alanine dipeptidase
MNVLTADTEPFEVDPFGEPLPALRAVPIVENGDPLQDPRELSDRIYFATKHPKFGDMERDVRVRKPIAEMLAIAANNLPDGMGLMILEGFRPLHRQRHEYEIVHAELQAKHPEWDAARLEAETNNVSAPPDDPCPPPHTTGGAVDLCPFYLSTGEYMDMVSPHDWDEVSAPTDFGDLTPQAQANRQFLRDLLEPTGLTNYAGEWWHWSYGDSGWALRVGATEALYDRLPEA